MKYLILLSLSLFTNISFCQDAAAPLPIELSVLVAEWDAKEKDMDAQLAPKLAELKKQCNDVVKAAALKLKMTNKRKDAEKLEHEAYWFIEHGQVAVPSKATPSEVKAAYAAYARGVQALESSAQLKRTSCRSTVAPNLNGMARALAAAGDKAGVAAVRQVSQILAVRNVISARGYVSTGLGGKSPLWQEVYPEGGVLVGFEVKKGAWFQFTVVKGVRPIYRTATGVQKGTAQGSGGKEQEAIAKEGYAVGAVVVKLGAVLDRFQVVFMKIKPDGLTLDPADQYESDWLGGEGGVTTKELTTRGRVAIGITGSTSGDTVEALGLVGVK